MFYPRNGRTIRIPVQRGGRQLPLVEEEPRPLLAEPVDCGEAVAQARDQTKAESEAEVASWKERALRLQAEAENVQKRAERRAEDQVRQQHRRMLMRLLTVADNLERALAHANEDDPLYYGVRLTLEDLMAQLDQEGIAPIQALGQPFDPHLHEAVAADGSGGDTVVQVVQTGYTLNGELLRPARVVVGQMV